MRILPLTMTAVLMLLAIKVAAVARGGEEVAQMFLVPSAAAESAPEQKPAASSSSASSAVSASSAASSTTSSAISSSAAASSSTTSAASSASSTPAAASSSESSSAAASTGSSAASSAESTKSEASSSEGSSTGPEAGKSGLKGHLSDEKPGADQEPGGGTGLAPGAHYFSPTELDVLQNLSKRRDQLDAWEKDIEVKENLMASAEKNIDEKVAQMEGMQKALKDLIVQYNDQEDSKIKSLVKIYEAMKPKDAARIFDEVEMPILLLVIDKMAEKKVAPILASMDSKKAKQLTVDLAEQRRLQGTKLGSACGVQPVPVSTAAPGLAPSASPAAR